MRSADSVLRVVIDTNVLLSGLLWHGAPHVLLEHVRAGTLGLVSSPRSWPSWRMSSPALSLT